MAVFSRVLPASFTRQIPRWRAFETRAVNHHFILPSYIPSMICHYNFEPRTQNLEPFLSHSPSSVQAAVLDSFGKVLLIIDINLPRHGSHNCSLPQKCSLSIFRTVLNSTFFSQYKIPIVQQVQWRAFIGFYLKYQIWFRLFAA
jgi:hypothetical protein